MSRHASLNRVYRLVWDAARNLWIPVAESARRRGKSGRTLIVAAAVTLTASGGWALPNGGVITAGDGQINTSPGQMTIDQNSAKLAIDWQDFSIDSAEQVRFVQPDASAVALNRVIGQNPSQILGGLQANGQVFVLNPNGVLFGVNAQVNVGGLVASTLGLSNQDFLDGHYHFAGDSAAGVINHGHLTAADGGYVALLGSSVSNDGVISARRGVVDLAAGQAVTLQLDNGALVGLTIDQGSAQALAANHGLIRADGGQVLLTAQAADSVARAVVNNDGIIEAHTIDNQNGVIRLLGDMASGEVTVAGTLDASAPQTGDGGFIETSAASVKVADTATVTASAANGVAGTWLLDPQNYTVAASGGDVTGAVVSATLNGGTNVTIASTAGSASGNGDIFINDAISWSTGNALTLNAIHDININADISASGASAGLALNPGLGGAGGTYNLAGGIIVTLSGVSPLLTIGGQAYTVINDIATLENLSSLPGKYNGFFAIGSEIDASATSGTGWNRGLGFTPIGDSTVAFAGVMEGLGHTITSLTINRNGGSQIGLFGVSSGTIQNLNLASAVIKGGSSTGVLVGENSGTISNSTVSGQLDFAPVGFNVDNMGGLAGINSGSINGSSANVALSLNGSVDTAANAIGGLVGQNTSTGVIGSSTALGAVNAQLTSTSTLNAVGGLAGQNDGSITGSTASGNVQATLNAGGTLSNVGGLAGFNSSTVKDSFANGSTVVLGFGGSSDVSNIGGLVGQNTGSVVDSLSSGFTGVGIGGGGTVNSVGGLIGNNAGTVNLSGFNSDPVTGGDVTVLTASTRIATNIQAVGGVIGRNQAAGSVTLLGGNIVYTGGTVTITHNNSGFVLGAGGIVGINSGTTGNFSHVNGTLNITIDDSTGAQVVGVGGIAGANAGTIDDAGGALSVADSNAVQLRAASFVGGVAGATANTIMMRTTASLLQS